MPGYKGTGGLTRFVDPLNDVNFYVDNWLEGHTWWSPIGSVFTTETFFIGAAADTFNALIAAFQGQSNPNQVIHSWTVPLATYFFKGKNQYVQMQRVRVNANGATDVIDMGLGLFLNTNPQANTLGTGLSGYNLWTITNSPGTVTLRRNNGGNSATDLNSFASADGDILRLEGVIISPSNIQLTAFKNGVQQFQINDNPSGLFAHFGVPHVSGAMINGMAGPVAGGAPQQQWRNFECGLL